jgi:hypothetical protein
LRIIILATVVAMNLLEAASLLPQLKVLTSLSKSSSRVRNQVYARAFDFLFPNQVFRYSKEKKGDYVEAILAACFLKLRNPLCVAQWRRLFSYVREDLEIAIEAAATGLLPAHLDFFMMQLPPPRVFLPFKMAAEAQDGDAGDSDSIVVEF